MPRLTVAADGRHLEQDGAPFPLIVDTLWSAFADPTEEEWRSYLGVRRAQGFTAVLVSLLPIPHDRDENPAAREPFAIGADGRPDFARPDDAYFAGARRFTRIAQQEYGIRLMLAVLWNNYLPGTWGADTTPWAVMPDDARRAYLARVVESFRDLDPIFVVGGDDSYAVPQANAAYLQASEELRAAAPDSLQTTHTAPRAELPDELADRLDFFLHQSGHNLENQELPWRQPEGYLARAVRKPLLASEPPYELHGIVNGSGRWSREDVRRVSWQSILAGASAGIGYGAHGVWMWHSPSGRFQAIGPSLEPLPWPLALDLPGARDISLLGALWRRHRLGRLDPSQGLLATPDDARFRVAASADRDLVVAYLPDAREVTLRLALDDYELTAWDLGERAPLTVAPIVSAEATVLPMAPTRHDQVVIAERRA